GSTYTLIGTDNSTAAPGTYQYTWASMPDNVTLTGRIKVTDATNESVVNAAMTGDFHLMGVFDILTPESGATVPAEGQYSITWDKGQAVGINNVILDYSTDGGSSWSHVNGTSPFTVPNSGTYSWNPTPATITTALKVKVYDPNNTAATSTGAGLSE